MSGTGEVYDADADAYGMIVTCPRCDRRTEASKIWVWFPPDSASLRQEEQSSGALAGARPRSPYRGQAERLRLVRGEIKQSGRGTPELFDLACGCTFSTRVWNLRVRSAVTLRDGGSMSIYVEPRYYDPRLSPELER